MCQDVKLQIFQRIHTPSGNRLTGSSFYSVTGYDTVYTTCVYWYLCSYIKFTCLDVVCKWGGHRVLVLYCDNSSCTFSIKSHSDPWSTLIWSHIPYCKMIGL